MISWRLRLGAGWLGAFGPGALGQTNGIISRQEPWWTSCGCFHSTDSIGARVLNRPLNLGHLSEAGISSFGSVTGERMVNQNMEPHSACLFSWASPETKGTMVPPKNWLERKASKNYNQGPFWENTKPPPQTVPDTHGNEDLRKTTLTWKFDDKQTKPEKRKSHF